MQSVNMRVPGLESNMSSGAVNTLPVTSSKWMLSTGLEQKPDCPEAGARRDTVRRSLSVFIIGNFIIKFRCVIFTVKIIGIFSVVLTMISHWDCLEIQLKVITVKLVIRRFGSEKLDNVVIKHLVGDHIWLRP